MLEVRLFGNLEVQLDGEKVELPWRPAQALLAYLALHPNQAHRREKLAGLLWPESEESNARRYLSQSLWRLRKTLGDDYFSADRLSISFAPRPGDQVDVVILESAETASPEKLTNSLEAYAGRLLPGFYEDWALAEAERLQRLFDKQVRTLLEMQLSEGRYQDALEWSERWLRLGEKPERAYRAMMRAFAGMGDRQGVASAYQRCLATLEADLGVLPSPETTALYEQIREGQYKPQRKGGSAPLDEVKYRPVFLDQEQPPEFDRPVFVARHAVLARLDLALERTIKGHGGVLFVLGEAGQGKSSLLDAFARKVQTEHPSIVYAMGTCNAYISGGDPYLPFREIFAMLTGDLESPWATGQVSTAMARQVWATLPGTVKVLLARGPHLLDTLVSGTQLLDRAEAAARGAPAVERLAEAVRASGRRVGELQQDFVFEQAANVLQALAEKQPLLLVLDDLHWADESTVNLLFHLGRRIQNSPILVLGAYRPEEIAPDMESWPHPMQQTVSDLKRLYGNIEVSLDDDSQVHYRAFVDDYLDSEPNDLGPAFREAFARLTGGHPLFVVETLREMQAEGEIYQDEAGRWISHPDISWDRFSAKVEGVIEKRIARLDAETRTMLAAASVEGEDFHVETLAIVLDRNARDLVRELSGPVSRQHKLIFEQGFRRLDSKPGNRLARYRFRHQLFQKYLYEQVGEIERVYLHDEVASALETIYGRDNPQAAPQLARHFKLAGRVEKEIHYLRLAGERAAKNYGYAEAAEYFSRALSLVDPGDLEIQWRLLRGREAAFSNLGQRDAQKEDLDSLDEISKSLSDERKMGQAAILRVEFAEGISDYAGLVKAAEKAIRFAEISGDKKIEGRANLFLGRVNWRTSNYEKALEYLKKALDLAIESGDRLTQGHALRTIGLISSDYGDQEVSESYFEQAIHIAREIGDSRGEMWSLMNLGVEQQVRGGYKKSDHFLNQALTIALETGDLAGEMHIRNNLGENSRLVGKFSCAAAHLLSAIRIAREIRDSYGEIYALMLSAEVKIDIGTFPEAEKLANDAQAIAVKIGYRRMEGRLYVVLGIISYMRQEIEQGLAFLQRGLEAAEQLGNTDIEGEALHMISNALIDMGEFENALDKTDRALEIWTRLGYLSAMADSRVLLARLYLAQGRADEAGRQMEKVLDYIGSEESPVGMKEGVRTYLTGARVFNALGDSRALQMLETGHRMLMERAANIADPANRITYLEEIPWHRELADLWNQQHIIEPD